MLSKQLKEIQDEIKSGSVSDESIKLLDKCIKNSEYLEGLRDVVDNEMAKEDDESDLLIIGEKVVSYLGYWG